MLVTSLVAVVVHFRSISSLCDLVCARDVFGDGFRGDVRCFLVAAAARDIMEFGKAA